VRVTSFDVNTIKFETDFKRGKFLVYNDSFHSDWHARINGRKASLYRANLAFKGLVLPAGKNAVELAFRPAIGGAVYVLTLMVFMGTFVYLVYLFSGAGEYDKRVGDAS